MAKRLISVDFLRGLTIGLMIIVNNPGSWKYVYAPLRHAQWHGWTPTDMVFPFFLFIVGVAIPLSFSKNLQLGVPRIDLYKKILRRTAIIFGLGLFLNGWPFGLPLSAPAAHEFTLTDILSRLQHIRLLGVLQRIALCYMLAAFSYLLIPRLKFRILFTIGMILLYEMGMRLPLIENWGAGSFELTDNFARLLDLSLLTENHMYRVSNLPFDPEGIWSTLTATVTTIIGIFCGEIILGKFDDKKKSLYLALLGFLLILIGYLLDLAEPFNKQLWTTSYTILMGGMAMVLLALSIFLIDLKGWKSMMLPFIAIGSNPIVIFVGSSFIAKNLYLIKVQVSQADYISVKTMIYREILQPMAGDYIGSFLYAFLFLTFWILIGIWMLRKKIYIKI